MELGLEFDVVKIETIARKQGLEVNRHSLGKAGETQIVLGIFDMCYDWFLSGKLYRLSDRWVVWTDRRCNDEMIDAIAFVLDTAKVAYEWLDPKLAPILYQSIEEMRND